MLSVNQLYYRIFIQLSRLSFVSSNVKQTFVYANFQVFKVIQI